MNSPITAIHVDDDLETLAMFRDIVATIPMIQLLASFDDAIMALDFVKSNPVNIVFSDMVMPVHDGLWLAKRLASFQVCTIFITSHTEYSLKAFEVSAVDYIIKPIQREKLIDALQRFRVKMEQLMPLQLKEMFNMRSLEPTKATRIFIHTIGQMRIVQLEDIMYFSSSSPGPYTNVYLADGELLLSSRVLKFYEDLLTDNPEFIRIHRRAMVNRKYVVALNRGEHTHSLQMKDGAALEVSRRRQEEIFNRLIA